MAEAFGLKDFKRIYDELSKLPEDVLQNTAKDFALRFPAKVTKAVCSEFNIPRQIMVAAGKHAKTQAFSQATSPGHDYRDITFEYSKNYLYYDTFKNAVQPKTPPTDRTGKIVYPKTIGAVKWAKKHGMDRPVFRAPKRYSVRAKIKKGSAVEVTNSGDDWTEAAGDIYKFGLPFVRIRKGHAAVYRSIVAKTSRGDQSIAIRQDSGVSLHDMVRDPAVFPKIQQEAGKLFAKRFEHYLGRAEKKLGR